MTRRSWTFVLILLLFVASTLAVVWWRRGEAGSSAPIRIGTISPLTGSGALYGKKLTQAVDLAFREANDAGGVLGRQLMAIHEDDRLEPRSAVSAAQKLISVDHVPVIIGAVASSATLAVAPIAESSKTVLITPISSAVKISHAGDFVFRIAPPDSSLARDAARWIHESGVTRVAVLYVNNDYGVGLEEAFRAEFKRLGGTVVLAEAFEQGAQDLRTQLTKAREADPQVIWAPAYMEEAGRLLRQRVELGIEVPIYGTDPYHDPLIFQGAGEAANGVRFMDVTSPSGPVFEAFAAKYKQRYGMDADIIAAESYDAALAVISAIKAAGTVDTTAIKDALYRVRFAGASGSCEFDANGDVPSKTFQRFEIRDGKYVPL